MAVLAAAAPLLSTLGTAASVAGAGLSLVGGLKQASAIRRAGRAEQQAKQYQADQQKQAAGQELAASQHSAAEQERQGRIMRSNAIALGASQGQSGNTSIMDILGNLDYESQYRKSLALFEGSKNAQQLEQGAALSTYEGDQAMKAAKTSASSTRLGAFTDFATSVGGTLYNKYKPKTDGFETIKWNQGGTSVIRK